MLSREENELITRVGPGTPMGNAMRRYWIPALLSRELAEPDGPPVRVRLLGEDLVAFRDSDGRIGLLEEFCPHRRASLFFGRNEECGLRCVYHGWKFDVDGNCVDMMNEPEEYDFKDKVRIAAYPTCELGGIVWAYLGPAGAHAAAAEVRLDAGAGGPPPRLQGDRGVQLAAGAGGRHRHLARADPAPAADRQLTRGGIKPSNPFVRGKAPKLVVDVTDYGYRYAGIRPLDGGDDVHIRTYHFIMPFHQIRPSTVGERSANSMPATSGCRWMTSNCMVYNWSYSPRRAADRRGQARARARQRPAARRSDDVPLQGATARNNYLLDREVQKTETFTGIDGINAQDRAMQESMGRVVDRSKEHLGPGRQGDHPGAQAAAPGGEDGRGRRHAGRHRHQLLHAARRTRPCCRAAPTGAWS